MPGGVTSPRVSGNEIKVLRVLTDHPCLDALQIASHALLSVSEARSAIKQLCEQQLVQGEPERDSTVYRLNKKELQRYVAGLYAATAALA